MKSEAFRLHKTGVSNRKIAERLGLSRGTLSYWFSPEARETARQSNHDYKRRRRAREGKPVDRVCDDCGDSFASTQGQQRRCPACRKKPKSKPTGFHKNPVKAKPSKQPPRRRDAAQVSHTLAAKIDARVARRITQAGG